jgi:sugar lactone lactonase YvrE
VSRRGGALAALALLTLTHCGRHATLDAAARDDLARALAPGAGGANGEPTALPPGALTVLQPPTPLRGANGLACQERRLLIAQAVGNAIARLAADGSGEPLALPSGLAGPDDLAVDEAGTLFVTAAASGTVWRRDAGGSWRAIATALPGANGIALDPGGRLFVTSCVLDGGDGIWEVDPQGARPPRAVARDLGCPNAMTADAPGSLVVPLLAKGEVVRVRADDGSVERVARGLRAPTAVKRAPDGSLVVLESGTGAIRALPASPDGAGEVLAQLSPGLDGFVTCGETALASSFVTGEVTAFKPWPDGSRSLTAPGLVVPRGLARAGEDVLVSDGVSLRRLRAGRTEVLVATALDPVPPPYAVAVAPDGFAWITVPHLGEVHRVDLAARTSDKVAGGFDWPTSIAALPTGDALVVDTGAGRVVRVAPDGATHTLTSGLASPVGLALRGTQALTLEPESGRVLAIRPGAAPLVVAAGLAGPVGLAADSSGRLYVAEKRTGGLVRIDTDGAHVRLAQGLALGVPGAAPAPVAVLVASDGSVLVASPVDGSVVQVTR